MLLCIWWAQLHRKIDFTFIFSDFSHWFVHILPEQSTLRECLRHCGTCSKLTVHIQTTDTSMKVVVCKTDTIKRKRAALNNNLPQQKYARLEWIKNEWSGHFDAYDPLQDFTHLTCPVAKAWGLQFAAVIYKQQILVCLSTRSLKARCVKHSDRAGLDTNSYDLEAGKRWHLPRVLI